MNMRLHPTKKEAIYEIILRRIIKCEYNSFDIITEKGLVNEFEMSKSPIREALIELKNQGFLTSIPRYGYQITNYTEKDIEELNEYRILIEYTSVLLFFEKLQKKDISKLQNFVNSNYQDNLTPKSALEYWELNTKFHLLLIDLLNNSYAKEKLEEAMKVLSVAYAQGYWKNYHTENIVSDCNCHKEIVQAIINNDKEKALKLLLEDIHNFKKLERQETKGEIL